MGPRKPMSSWANDESYPKVLHNFCRDEDVLILPEFMIRVQRPDLSPTKSREFRLVECLDVVSSVDDAAGEDPQDLPRPPPITILYDYFEEKESPIAVICKNIYIEHSLIHAFAKSLSAFPSVQCLKIENCCISEELAQALAAVLAEEPGRQISDLSLDGNSGIAGILPSFICLPTGLKYLSLQRCSLGDEDVKSLTQALVYSDEGTQQLVALNLGMNRIGNAGALHLASALRSNRTLISLSLAGNQIEDEGAAHLIEVLKKFRLTHQETMFRRRRIFSRIAKRKNLLEKVADLQKAKQESSAQTAKNNARQPRRFSTAGKTSRGTDVKMCSSIRDRRGNKASAAKMNVGEKPNVGVGIPNGTKEFRKNSNRSELFGGPYSAQSTSEFQDEISADKHPFVDEVAKANGELWCRGCWSIRYINLAYNYLTEKSVDDFSAVLDARNQICGGQKNRPLTIKLLPGNFITEVSHDTELWHNSHRSTRTRTRTRL